MSQLITWESWALSEEADRRFRRIVAVVAVPAILLALLFTFWQLAEVKTPPPEYNGTQTVDLLAEQQPPGEVAPPEQPKPAPENKQEKPQQAPKQQVKPVPQPVPQPTAREKAQKEINKAFDQLNDLRDQNLSALNNQVLNTNTPTLSSRGGVGGGAEAIANSAAANSGGGIGGTGSYTSTQSGTGLGTRRTGAVNSNIGFGRDVSKAGANGKVDNGRSILQVQEVFDRNIASFYAIYNRAARADPSIAEGKIVLHLVIAPDGSVSSCTLVSSTFNNPDFEGKVMARVRLINFGAKAVPPFDVPHYPLDFHPM